MGRGKKGRGEKRGGRREKGGKGNEEDKTNRRWGRKRGRGEKRKGREGGRGGEKGKKRGMKEREQGRGRRAEERGSRRRKGVLLLAQQSPLTTGQPSMQDPILENLPSPTQGQMCIGRSQGTVQHIPSPRNPVAMPQPHPEVPGKGQTFPSVSARQSPDSFLLPAELSAQVG